MRHPAKHSLLDVFLLPAGEDHMQTRDEPPTPYSLLARIKGDINMWLWYSGIADSQSRRSPEEIKQANLKKLPRKQGAWLQQILMLHSQFRALITPTNHTDGEPTYAQSKDFEALEECPVILTSTIPHPFFTHETQIETYRIYPPPTHGTASIVISKEKWYYYSLELLPEEAQERQKQLGQRIEELEASTKDKFTQETHIFDKDVEVKAMIQQLAQDYYQYHESLQKKNNLPHAVNPFNDNGIAPTSTCSAMQLFTYATQNAIAGGTRWKHPKGHLPYFPYNGNIIEYRGDGEVITDEIANSLWEQVKQQNYTVIDMAAFAISLFARSQEPDHSAWVYASKFIESRGLTKQKKAVTDEITRDAGHQQKNYHL
jgi:hypothetical protein